MEVIWYMYPVELLAISFALLLLVIIFFRARAKKKEVQNDDEFYEKNPDYNPEYLKFIKSKKRVSWFAKILLVGALFSIGYDRFYEPSIEEQEEAYKEYVLKLDSELKKYAQIADNMIRSVPDAAKSEANCAKAKTKLEAFPKEIDSVKIDLPSRDIGFKKRKSIMVGIIYINNHKENEKVVSKKLINIVDKIQQLHKRGGNANEGYEVEKMLDEVSSFRRTNNNNLLTGWVMIAHAFLRDTGLYYNNGKFIRENDENKVLNNSKSEVDKIKKESADDFSNNLTSLNLNDTSSVSDNDPLSLGGVSLNNTEAEIKSILGTPNNTETKNSDTTVLKYNDVEVYITNNKIEMLISNSPNAKTSKGIHEQSYIDDFTREYGNNYQQTEYNNLNLMEYNINDKNGNPCILRFAVVKGDNKVNYISIRRAD